MFEGNSFDLIYTQEIEIMKKLIQICSFLSLLVVFAVASANAHTVFGSEVEIPFAFSVGDKSYDAGHYIVKVTKISNGTASLSIQDTKDDSMQTVLMTVNGDDPSSGKVNLVFETARGTKYLSKVSTSSNTFALRIPAPKKGAAVIGSGANLF